MRKKCFSFSMMLMLILTLVCSTVIKTNAAEVQLTDVVMVLDQSGSMKSNDPNGMMKEAANMLIEMMPSNTGRIGVISFNRSQTKVAELTELYEIDNIDSLITGVDQIEYKGDTDIGNAVADAVEMFDKEDGRIHKILILSDGRNDFGIEKNEEQKSDERLNDALIEAENQNCQIYCLGFGNEMADTNGVAYQKLLNIATSEEHISTETDPNNIHQFFVKVLTDVIGGKIQSVTDTIKIEPNVKEANIYMNSLEDISDVEVTLQKPDGTMINLENNDDTRFYKSKYSAVIKLFKPEAGEYTITTSKENIEIDVGYIPSYEYILDSRVVDQQGKTVEEIANGTTGEIRVVICQDGNVVTESEVYTESTAQAVVTANDTGEQTTVTLQYQGGELKGNVIFDHLATYEIEIQVESDSFNLKDHLDITTNQRAISLSKNGAETVQIEKKVIDKTLKKSAELLVEQDELLSVISDPDQVGVNVDKAISSDEDKVEVELQKDGLMLTGKKWGSALVTVTYKDGLGNKVQTSFNVKVEDKLRVAFFAMLPILIGAVVALIVYLVMKKSKMIKGNFEINKIEIRKEDMTSTVAAYKTYTSRNFIGKKKSLGNGVWKYVQEVYAQDSSLPENAELYQMFAGKQSEVKKNLDEVKFVGTYLGLKGCSLRVKKGKAVSVGTNQAYGKAVKINWASKKDFNIYTKDESGTELHINGKYDPVIRTKKAPKAKKKTVETKNPTDMDWGETDTDDLGSFFN